MPSVSYKNFVLELNSCHKIFSLLSSQKLTMKNPVFVCFFFFCYLNFIVVAFLIIRVFGWTASCSQHYLCFFVLDNLIRTFIFLHIRLKFPILVVVVIRLILIMHNQGHY